MVTGTTALMISLVCDLGRLGAGQWETTWVIVCAGTWVDGDSDRGYRVMVLWAGQAAG
jgi:hypothetical protein